MPVYGMDPQQAQRLSDDASLFGNDMEALCAKLQQEIESLDWFGPDALTFRSETLASVLNRLEAVRTRSIDLSTSARENMNGQIQASGGSR